MQKSMVKNKNKFAVFGVALAVLVMATVALMSGNSRITANASYGDWYDAYPQLTGAEYMEVTVTSGSGALTTFDVLLKDSFKTSYYGQLRLEVAIAYTLDPPGLWDYRLIKEFDSPIGIYHRISFADVYLVVNDFDATQIPAGSHRAWFRLLVGEYPLLEQILPKSASVVSLSEPFPYVYAPLPPDPELAHHDFDGWFMDENFTIPYTGQLIYEHTPLYAKFIVRTYRITYVTGVSGLTYPQKQVTALTAAGLLPTPSRTGYTFAGWFLDEGRTQKYTEITSMTGNITLYAGFEQIVLTVTFYVKGEVYATVEVPYGSALSVAVAAAQSDSEIIKALYADPNLHNALSVNTVLTSDTNVHAELGAGVDGSGFFGRVGQWFADSWIWLVVCVAIMLAAAATVLIILKKRGVL